MFKNILLFSFSRISIVKYIMNNSNTRPVLTHWARGERGAGSTRRRGGRRGRGGEGAGSPGGIAVIRPQSVDYINKCMRIAWIMRFLFFSSAAAAAALPKNASVIKAYRIHLQHMLTISLPFVSSSYPLRRRSRCIFFSRAKIFYHTFII